MARAEDRAHCKEISNIDPLVAIKTNMIFLRMFEIFSPLAKNGFHSPNIHWVVLDESTGRKGKLSLVHWVCVYAYRLYE